MSREAGDISIRNPERKRFAVSMSDLTGRDWNTIERGYWKQTRDAHVTPRVVKEYIRTKLLGLPPEDDSEHYGCTCDGVYKHRGMAGKRRRFECTGCKGVCLECSLCSEPRGNEHWADPKQEFCELCCWYYQSDKLPIDQEEKLWALAEGKF